MNLKQYLDYNQIWTGRRSSHMLECTAAPNSRLPKITTNTVHTNITHKVCVHFLFSTTCLVHTSWPSSIEKYRYRRKSATKETSPSQSDCPKCTRYSFQKRKNKNKQ